MFYFNFFITKNRNDRSKLLRFPRTPQDIQDIVQVVNKYTGQYFYHVLALFISVYIL